MHIKEKHLKKSPMNHLIKEIKSGITLFGRA
jgi:hypothetical protein